MSSGLERNEAYEEMLAIFTSEILNEPALPIYLSDGEAGIIDGKFILANNRIVDTRRRRVGKVVLMTRKDEEVYAGKDKDQLLKLVPLPKPKGLIDTFMFNPNENHSVLKVGEWELHLEEQAFMDVGGVSYGVRISSSTLFSFEKMGSSLRFSDMEARLQKQLQQSPRK